MRPEVLGLRRRPAGAFHLDCGGPGAPVPPRRVLRHWDARTGRDRPIATVEGGALIPLGLSVSPDGHGLLFTRFTSNADVMMIENFR